MLGFVQWDGNLCMTVRRGFNYRLSITRRNAINGMNNVTVEKFRRRPATKASANKYAIGVFVF